MRILLGSNISLSFIKEIKHMFSGKKKELERPLSRVKGKQGKNRGKIMSRSC